MNTLKSIKVYSLYWKKNPILCKLNEDIQTLLNSNGIIHEFIYTNLDDAHGTQVQKLTMLPTDIILPIVSLDDSIWSGSTFAAPAPITGMLDWLETNGAISP